MSEQLARETVGRFNVASEDTSSESGQGAPQFFLVPNKRSLPVWRRYVNGIIASEISSISRYYDSIYQWRRRQYDTGILLDQVDCREKREADDYGKIDFKSRGSGHRGVVLINGNVNYEYDFQKTLSRIKTRITRGERLILVVYNSYFRPLYALANRLGLRKGPQPETFITYADLHNLAKISGYEVVRTRPCLYCPLPLLGIGSLINRVFPSVPLLRYFGLASVMVLRPLIANAENQLPSLSIVIPARNERGNIENALKRLKNLEKVDFEVIFVEGHSKDGTWKEIQRVAQEYADTFQIKIMQQTGKGKADAVRLGFAHASKDLLTILDADLTMPPELLYRFYDAYCQGLADFVNGSRLVYPMEGEAMRSLNFMGNVFFAKALSLVLGNRLGDSLCGTKLLTRTDYDRFIAWRTDFGDFDPFGDYELLFPASELALGIIDIPIRYRDRTYGSTNISRFWHGAMLLKMTLIGLFRIRFGKIRQATVGK